MYLNDWLRKWYIVTFICLFIMIGCGAALLWDNYRSGSESSSQHVVNKVRIQVSEIMLFLEKFNHELDKDPKLQEDLQVMTQDFQVGLVYAALDGQIIFNSSPTNSTHQIDLKSSVHYDLYHAKINKDTYSIAFPVVDQATQNQVGNAIFVLPTSRVLVEKSHATALFLFIMMTSVLFIFCGLLFLLRKKFKRDIIQPIRHLKDYSEGIIKGNYEQKITYHSMDEIGEVYAMFDQMRMEILHHSFQRDEQQQLQKELISNISHEIKTPLTTLKAYIEALREGVCSDMSEVMEYVEVMHTNTDKMTRLTEDLLLHALKELGQISVTLTEQYSGELLNKILQPIGHYVGTLGVSFLGPSDIPDVLILADANRLEQVISNLVANALKHTSVGDSIRVDIVVGQGHLKIMIADTGKGMLPQDMPFVFDRYFKGKLNTDSRNEGSGLGLSICKHIVEAHHGTISFKSIQGEGTVFHFTIPLC